MIKQRLVLPLAVLFKYIAFLEWFALIVCGNNNLQWTDPITNTKFDLSALKRNPNNPYKVKDGVDNGLFSMNYYFNFGESHSKKCKSQQVAVTEVLEVLKQSTDTCEVWGRTESQTFGLIDPSNPKKGVFVLYGDGDKCSSSDNPALNGKPRQTKFNIHCAKSQTEFRVDLPGGTQGTTKCLLEFTVNSPSGCPGGRYSTYTSSAILFWVIFGFGLYMLIGIVYNIRKNNWSGKEAIPNIEFWRVFPNYVKDGVNYSVATARNGVRLLKGRLSGEATPENYSDI